ncbi:hypothetical protein [Brachybacterium kimchii]|uniref:Uncharacterized protein n=1 Tax=Brachybacterium kimchii TaxID=2942909 RepID=A0ABY4N8R8_9MICO|nr:hypothetical protein [Brachybacterium kimchii]UQN30496.1 hypothetical protein M4486_03900 [Brachybacterium kimchii]
MSSKIPDTVLIPLSRNCPPYRIDDVSADSRYVRIRKTGPDVLALVPPGDDAGGYRIRLISELQAYSTKSITTRRYHRLLYALLFGFAPLLLIAALIVTSAGLIPMPDNSVLSSTAPIVCLGVLIIYLVLMLTPNVGAAYTLTSAVYPTNPEYALRDISTSGSGIRYLTEDDFAGEAAMEALRHDVLSLPESVGKEEWAALWVLAARNHLYASALVSIRKLAQLRLDQILKERRREFAAELQVCLEDLGDTSSQSPPTSPGEGTDTREAA